MGISLYPGLKYERQRVYPLYYKGQPVSAYIADLEVEDTIIVELKSVKELHKTMEAVAGFSIIMRSIPTE
ncbi:MAG: GxxExxY protein [Spirochaetales bacterium]|nr:GxxExxY protein [Spirochaetales bacterium]